MFKRCKLVMLPSKEKAPIAKFNNTLYNVSKNKDYSECIYQHLYILSDDEIKEGDWCVEFHLDWTPKEVFQCKGSIPGECIVRKIIATTDKLLNYDLSHIPQPSQSFIEKYIIEYSKGNIISEVMVEYEYFENDTSECIGMNGEPNGALFNGYNLKISPTNTITIKKVKDSWNREEVLLFAEKYARMVQEKEIQLNGYKLIHNQKWIKENL